MHNFFSILLKRFPNLFSKRKRNEYPQSAFPQIPYFNLIFVFLRNISRAGLSGADWAPSFVHFADPHAAPYTTASSKLFPRRKAARKPASKVSSAHACKESKTHFQRDKQISIKQKIHIYCRKKSESLHRGDADENHIFREMFGI